MGPPQPRQQPVFCLESGAGSRESPPTGHRIQRERGSHLIPTVQASTCTKLRSGTGGTPKEIGVQRLSVWGGGAGTGNPGGSVSDTHAAPPGPGTLSARSAGTRPRPGPPRRLPPRREHHLRTKGQGRRVPTPQPPRDPKAPGSGERAGRRSTLRRSYWLEVTPIWLPRPGHWPAGEEFAEPQ